MAKNNGMGSSSHKSLSTMTMERARQIQRHADRTGTNQDFKARAMRAAWRNHVKREGTTSK
jgi:hypothetical protein